MSEQLKILTEVLRILELEQIEEFAARALKMLAVRAFLKSLAVRALTEKHWICGQASLV